MRFCKHENKRVYETIGWARRQVNKKFREGVELSIYPCQYCGGYHVTSKSSNEANERLLKIPATDLKRIADKISQSDFVPIGTTEISIAGWPFLVSVAYVDGKAVAYTKGDDKIVVDVLWVDEYDMSSKYHLMIRLWDKLAAGGEAHGELIEEYEDGRKKYSVCIDKKTRIVAVDPDADLLTDRVKILG